MPASISTRLERPNLPATGGRMYAEITVEPGDRKEDVNRQVALVIDTSGSMAGEKMEQAKQGAKSVFGFLDDDDFATIIEFAGGATCVLEASRVGDLTRDQFHDAVDRLDAGGGTNIYGALELAQTELEQLSAGDETARRILLLSDGRDNQKGPSDFERLARTIDDAGIRIMASGIGDDYHMDTIQALGTTARGEWIHLENASDILDFFSRTLDEASTLVASDAQIEFDLADGVEVDDVYRAMPQVQPVEVEWSNNVGVVKLPDLLERQRQRIVLELYAPEREIGQDVTLANITLDAMGEFAEGRLETTYTDDNSLLSVRNEDVAANFYGTVIRDQGGNKGDIAAAETVFDEASTVLQDETVIKEVEDVTEQATQIQGREEQYQSTIVKEDDKRFG